MSDSNIMIHGRHEDFNKDNTYYHATSTEGTHG